MYMHGAAPIVQYMAASTQFNPLSQQIIIYVRAKWVVVKTGMTETKCETKRNDEAS